MLLRFGAAAALLAALTLFPAVPAMAQGEILITQAKALNGNVTPNDPPGFPVILTVQGSYILGSNLQVPAGKIGIQVNSHHVDIDMNGFRLAGGGVGGYGVYSSFGQSRIHDGVITTFKNDGILLVGNSNAWTIENMKIIQNQKTGVNAEVSDYHRILNSAIVANGNWGVACQSFCHIEGNTVSGNGHFGIYLANSGMVLGNSVFANGATGVWNNSHTPGNVGIGNNTFVGNGIGLQTSETTEMQPNNCSPTACD